VEVAAGREDEEGAANGGTPLLVGQLDGLAGEIRQDDELYLVSRSDTRLRSSRA